MPPKEDPLVRFWRKVDNGGPVSAHRPDLYGPRRGSADRAKVGYPTFRSPAGTILPFARRAA